MKKIKIKICNFDPTDPFSYGNFLIKVLRKNYEVEVVSENPEYLFFNEAVHEQVKYDCIKIFYTGENVHPNFNLTDYAIGCDYMTFRDRYFRLPIYLVAQFYSDKELATAGNYDFTIQRIFTQEDLKEKTEFCSFVYSNYLGGDTREKVFHKLSEYKKVNAGGNYLNNIGGRVANKLEFELKHKFSIAFENSSGEGYTTEKLPNALVAKTIPIYWGNPEITKEFNGNRFINCHSYNTLDEVIKRVIEIDTNDSLYLKIINEPVTIDYDFQQVLKNFETFLKNIIDQPLNAAKRIRINPVRALEINKSELVINKYLRNRAILRKVLAGIYRPLKMIKVLDRVKQRYFQKSIYK